MLKSSTKGRLLAILLSVLFLVAMLATPLTRDYSTLVDATKCAKGCTGDNLTTDVHYGVPFAWLTLSKTVDQNQHAVASSTQKDVTKLLIDVATWLLIITAFVLIRRTGVFKL